MRMHSKFVLFFLFALFIFFLLFHIRNEVTVISEASYIEDKATAGKMEEMRKSNLNVLEKYRELRLIDSHSHDVDSLDFSERNRNENYTSVTDLWERYGVDRTALFGAVSDPAAIKSDRLSWYYYEKYPKLIYPSIGGVQIDKNSSGMAKLKENLEKGYMQIGELFAASTYSPHASAKWKAKHPYDGNLPEVYELASEYHVPVLLHIDPPSGFTIQQFELAMKKHSNTTFIFAHANVYTSPEFLRKLLAEHDNLVIDFFAGFTLHNPASKYELIDFTRVVEEFPDRFVLGSDSGFDIGIDKSYLAMYEFIDLLSSERAVKVAYQNYERLMEIQEPTQEQIHLIKKLAVEKGITNKVYRVNKREANELIFTLQK